MTHDKLIEALKNQEQWYKQNGGGWPDDDHAIIYLAAKSTLATPDTQGTLDEEDNKEITYLNLENLKQEVLKKHRNSLFCVGEFATSDDGIISEIFDHIKNILNCQQVVIDNQDVLDALDNVSRNNPFIEGSPPWEDFERRRSQGVEDIRTALTRPSREAKLLDALKAVIESPQVRSDLHPDRLKLAKQAIAEAEGE